MVNALLMLHWIVLTHQFPIFSGAVSARHSSTSLDTSWVTPTFRATWAVPETYRQCRSDRDSNRPCRCPADITTEVWIAVRPIIYTNPGRDHGLSGSSSRSSVPHCAPENVSQRVLLNHPVEHLLFPHGGEPLSASRHLQLPGFSPASWTQLWIR